MKCPLLLKACYRQYKFYYWATAVSMNNITTSSSTQQKWFFMIWKPKNVKWLTLNVLKLKYTVTRSVRNCDILGYPLLTRAETGSVGLRCKNNTSDSLKTIFSMNVFHLKPFTCYSLYSQQVAFRGLILMCLVYRVLYIYKTCFYDGTRLNQTDATHFFWLKIKSVDILHVDIAHFAGSFFHFFH